MKTIRTRTAIAIIVAFGIVAFSVSFAVSRLPRKSEWERFRVEYPERAIRANLRLVVLAAAAYLRTHDADEITYDDLLRHGQVIDRPIEPVLGEDYHTIRLSRADAKVDIVTQDGRTVTCEFGTFGVGPIGAGPVRLPPPEDFNAIHPDTN